MARYRTHVFICYSHVDRDYLSRLRVHLRPFERTGLVEVWADSKITPGSNWQQEIRKAIDKAAVAICLVSADFLASDFIAENELPPLLSAAAKQGVPILPVILKPCAFADISELAALQSVNDPAEPLAGLPECEQEKVWYQVAIATKEALDRQPASQAIEVSQAVPGHGQAVERLACLTPLIGPAESIRDYHVYQYHFLDDLSYMFDADEVLEEDTLKAARKRFLEAGWEGDGRLQVLWLPPFLGAGVEDTYGLAVLHVKQNNNGTSWIASPVPLPFARLLEQN